MLRRGVLTLITAALLAGPSVAAFDGGAVDDAPRQAAAIGALALLALAALLSPGRLLPASAPARAALAALAGLTAWTAVARSWSPSPGGADAALELAVLYLALLAASTLLLRPAAAARAVEPVLALGGVVVCAYGLAGRLLPGIVELTHSPRAGGRIDQPLGYWNAEGLLAALTLVLAARVSGDRTRPEWMRALGAAALPVAGAVVYLSFSRAAIAAAAVGLLLLVILHPVRTQARAALLAAVAGGLAAAVIAPLDGVRALAGDLAARERDGAVALLLLLALGTAAAGAQLRWIPRELPGRRIGRAWRRAAVAGLAIAVVLPFAAAVADREDGASETFGATTARLTDAGSNRAHYWGAALRRVADDPLVGGGAGSFEATWLRERTIDERVRNAHSLELETAAELGLVGLALLAAMLVAVALTARRALAFDPAPVVGAAAALATWLLGASLDWHWQIPAVTGIAAILAGLLLARDHPGCDGLRAHRATAARAAVGGDEPRPSAEADTPEALAPPPGHPRFPLLDGVRALAALSIVGMHIGDASGFTNAHEILGGLTARLNVGVAIFFVLSGFLLYRPFVAARMEGRPAPRIGRYLRRRALRIVPAFWTAMLIMLALGWIGVPGGWWRYFLFAQNMSNETILFGIGPAWTLDIEVAFYLTLPLWALGAVALLRRLPPERRVRAELTLLGLVALLSFASRLVAAERDPHSTWLVSFPGHLGWFAGGMALALMSVWLSGRALPRGWAFVAQRPALAWAVAAAAYLVSAYALNLHRGFEGDPNAWQQLGGHVLYLVVAMLVVLPAVLPAPARPGTASRAILGLLGHPVTMWLGLVSYGIFLWHQPFLNWLILKGFMDWAPGLPVAWLTVVVTAGGIALGAASYYLIERPFLSLKEPHRRRVAPAAASAG
jgi:peptidoglycan/LPS O-acetylase OafA/YrhL